MDIRCIFNILTVATLVFYAVFVLYVIHTIIKNKRDVSVNDVIWPIGFILLFIISIARIIIALKLHLSSPILRACSLSLLYAILGLILIVKRIKNNVKR